MQRNERIIMIVIKNIFRVHTVIRDVFIRFPLPVLLAFSAVIASWLLIHKVVEVDNGIIPLFYLSIAINFVAQTVFKLYSESESWSLKKYHSASLIILIAIVFYSVHFIASQHIVAFIFLIIALLLSILFAPYLRQKSTMNSFWYFNYQTGSALFFAGIAGLILGGGLSLILVSITYLFDVDIDKLLYADIWFMTGMGFIPLYILTNISKQFNYKEESCDFPKGISFISNYLLVPLMIAYMLVLYAYFIKITLQWELPKGYLGWMIIGFGSIGVLTKLLTYPICDKANRLLSLFDKYFYKALILPVLMLFFAIIIRVNDYGITEQRYAVVLLGVWFATLILLSVFYKEKFHIKHVPMILAVLALFAAYGPWSAGSISLNSQMKQFENLLVKNQLLESGVIKINKNTGSITYEDRRSLFSIADYLSGTQWRRDAIRETLQSWNYDQVKFKKEIFNELTARQVLSRLNVEYAGRRSYENNKQVERFHYSGYQNLNSTLIETTGYNYINRSSFYNYQGKHVKKHLTLKEGKRTEKITLSLEDNTLNIVRNDGDRAHINLEALVLSLKSNNIKKITEENYEKMIMDKTSTNGKFKVRVVVENLTGKISAKSKVIITNFKYVLMIDIRNSEK